MGYATEATIYANDDWHPEDRAWLKERKEQWRDVKFSLGFVGAAAEIKRKQFKAHQELFLYGTISEETLWETEDRYPSHPELIARERSVDGGNAFRYKLAIFWLWYHPNPAKIDINALREECISAGRNKKFPSRWHSDFYRDWPQSGYNFNMMNCEGPDRPSYDPRCGMMGGREELVSEFLWEKPDYYSQMTGYGTVNIYAVYYHCFSDTRDELRRDATFIPYRPGQYLWDQLGHLLEHRHDEFHEHRLIKMSVENKGHSIEHGLKMVMAEVWAAVDSTDRPHRRESTQAMVQRLIACYERGDFPPALEKLWGEARDNMKVLRQEAYERGYFEKEQKRLDKVCSKKQQEERVAQWKLI